MFDPEHCRRVSPQALAAAFVRGALCLGLPLFSAFVHEARANDVVEKCPLPPPSVPRGKTLFVELPAEVTSVRTENSFNDPRMRGDLYQEFEGGSIGTGVAIGDYDNDGKPDIFVVSKTETCRLFRNLGGWRFEDVTERSGVGDVGAAAAVWKSGVTFVDVNNDGLLDLYLCRFNAPNLLYINQGDGTFKERAQAYGLAVKDASVMAAFCDYDRDGWLDVYIATNMLNNATGPKGQRGYMFHNNGNGTFTNVTDRAGISGETRSHSATWWDYDNDGWPDLYVAYDYGVPDSLYHNNRDGTFTDTAAKFLPHTAFSAMGADFGDVNNDGLIDFFVADMAGTTHEKDQHIMADARGRDEDRPDEATTLPKYHRNALLLSTGTGYCLEGAFLAGLDATDWTWAPRLEDLDNDGRLDLFVTNGFPRDPGVDVVKKQMSAESGVERIRIMYESPMRAENKIARRNLGDLRFEDVGAAWGLDKLGVSFGAAFGDLDGDGDLDLVYSNYQAGASVLRNDCDRGHRILVALRGTASNRFGVGATVRIESALGIQVRQLGLSRGYLSSSDLTLHFGLGEDTVVQKLVVTWPSGREQTFANLGVDQRYTITEPSSDTPPTLSGADARASHHYSEESRALGLSFRSREEAVNETSEQRLLPFRLNRRGPALAVGPLTPSGVDDVIFGGTTREPLRVLRAAPDGKFRETPSPVTTPAAVNDGPVLLFDANGDGNNDLFVTRGGNTMPAGMPDYQPALFWGDGLGGFRAASEDALPSLPLNVGAAVAADFNRDGRLDVFLGGRVATGSYPQAPQSALLVNRGGKFEDVTDELATGLRDIGMVTSALWTDVDGDGWLDLMLTLDWGHVKYFHNRSGAGFDDWSDAAGFTAAGTGWWTSLAAADFNGDGRLDYVVGNVGLNTQYHADPAHPALLFSGDFKGDGSSQLVEAYYEGESIYPWRSRRDLGAVLPGLLKRFPLNNTYARATLSEVFGEAKLAKAERFAATELRSGVFLSRSDGSFGFEPLPRLAQIAPLQGLVAGDFDGDGKADIYAVQNSFAPVTAIGRFDGGYSQMLRGDGRGHFTVVSPADNALFVQGDAKALALLDLNRDGWPDFLVTRNNDDALAFRNPGMPGAHSLRVMLRGAPGNAAAAGALVTVTYGDGSVVAYGVYLGGGYMTQSVPACFVGYTDANPPKKLSVRWPNGALSEHPFVVASGAVEIVLSPAK